MTDIASITHELEAAVALEVAEGATSCILRVESPRHGFVWEGSAGTVSGDDPTLVPAEASFRIASVTKTFTAVVVMQLIDEGRLGLDDPVRDHLPADIVELLPLVHVFEGVSYGERITVRQLLRHSSGLFDFAASDGFFAALFRDPQHVWCPREVVQGAIEWGSPHFAPDSGYMYAYSDTGYVILGAMIQHVEGRTLHESYRHRILGPLGLHNTYLEGFEDHRGPVLSHCFEGSIDAMQIHGSADWSGGGLVSTTADLAAFARAFIAGRLVAGTALATMLEYSFRTLDPTLHSPGFLGYGLGVEARDCAGRLWRGHRGHWGVLMHVSPADGSTITGTINRSDRRPDTLMLSAASAVASLG